MYNVFIESAFVPMRLIFLRFFETAFVIAELTILIKKEEKIH